MEKNYYEILEVDKNASSEIIEKSYKILVKRYHPDLQENSNKQAYEQKLKLINEAYDVLSDTIKRNEYDNSLANNTISKEDFEKLQEENSLLEQELYNLQQLIKQNTTQTSHQPENFDYQTTAKAEQQYQDEIQKAREQAYQDAYVQDLKQRGYRIRYKKTFRDYVKDVISFVILIFILVLLWQIPFVHNYFIDLYNENNAFHILISPFVSIFQ